MVKSVNLHTPLNAPVMSRGILSCTWNLIQGRLWPLIEEALFFKKDEYQAQGSFKVAVLGKIIISTDSEQDDAILKFNRYSENIKGGYGWDTFARICFGWNNLIMADKTAHGKLIRILGPLFNDRSIRERYYQDLQVVTQNTLLLWSKQKEGIPFFDAALEHSCKAVTTCFLGKEAANSDEIIKAVRHLMALFWDNAQMKPWALICQVSRRVFGQKLDLDGYWQNHKILEVAIEQARKSASEDSFIANLIDQELIDNMKMFYFAGTETTGSLILSLFVFLAANGEIQEEIRQEVLRAKELDFNTLHQLPKLKAALYEALRLVPPLPVQVRSVITKQEIYAYFINHYYRLRDIKLAGKDPDQFNPARFDEKPQLFEEVDRVFGSGHNPCIGKSFAITESLLLIASALNQGTIELIEDYPTEVIREAGAHLSSDIKIRFKFF